MEKNNNSNCFKNFLASTAGYYTLSIILAIILWGIIFALWTSATEAGVVVMVICAIFGWIALNKVQPSMFLWMSWVGWIIYFVLKFSQLTML